MSQLLKYFTLDVLSDQGVKGIPLSVVVVDEELDFTEYSKIAREFEPSDTSFVRYSEEKNTLEVRSFSSIGIEIQRDGHYLLGAVHTVLFNEHLFKPNLDEIPEIFMRGSSISISVNGHDLKLLRKLGLIKKELDMDNIATAISFLEVDWCIADLNPTIVETDALYLIVPINSFEILNRCKPKIEFLQTLLDVHGIQGIYCFSFSEENSKFFGNIRFFNTEIGINENFDTNAAGALASFLKFQGYFKENQVYAMLQEEPRGRSLVIKCKVEENFVLIGGTAVITGEDAIHVECTSQNACF